MLATPMPYLDQAVVLVLQLPWIAVTVHLDTPVTAVQQLFVMEVQ